MATVAVRTDLNSQASTFLVFEIAARFCAIPAESVAEIVPMATLSRSPGQPAVLEGFLNLRGTAVPVVRVHRLFDVPESVPGLYTPLVVLRRRSPIALLVDRVVDIAQVGREALQPIGEDASFSGCAQAQFPFGGQTAYVLSPDRVVLEKERQCILDLQARAQRYLDELEA